MKKKLNVAILIHPEMNPLKVGLARSKNVNSLCKTESFVYSSLKKQGHHVEFLELDEHLDALVSYVNAKPVDITVNLLEELAGETQFDFHAVCYLESKGVNFTGNGPRALMLSRDKALAKMMVRSLGVLTPEFRLIRNLRDLKNHGLQYPVFLKFNTEDASLGISQKNRARNFGELKKIFQRLRKVTLKPLLLEEFVAGSDLYVGALGNGRIKVFPAREMKFPEESWVAGEDVKFKSHVRAAHKIKSRSFVWPSVPMRRKFEEEVRAVVEGLGLRGYMRLDYRIGLDGKIYFLEANANPNLSMDEDFAMSAKAFGISYDALVSEILTLGKAKIRKRL